MHIWITKKLLNKKEKSKFVQMILCTVIFIFYNNTACNKLKLETELIAVIEIILVSFHIYFFSIYPYGHTSPLEKIK